MLIHPKANSPATTTPTSVTHGPHKTHYFIYHLKPNSHHHKPTKSIGKTQQPPPQTHEIYQQNPTPAIAMAKHNNTIGPDQSQPTLIDLSKLETMSAPLDPWKLETRLESLDPWKLETKSASLDPNLQA